MHPRFLAAKRIVRASGESLVFLSPPVAIARLQTRARPASVGAPCPNSCQVSAQRASFAEEGSKFSAMDSWNSGDVAEWVLPRQHIISRNPPHVFSPPFAAGPRAGGASRAAGGGN